MEILSEEVLHEQGCFRRVRRWLRGWHPDFGVLTWGMTGKETVAELCVVRASISLDVDYKEANHFL